MLWPDRAGAEVASPSEATAGVVLRLSQADGATLARAAHSERRARGRAGGRAGGRRDVVHNGPNIALWGGLALPLAHALGGRAVDRGSGVPLGAVMLVYF